MNRQMFGRVYQATVGALVSTAMFLLAMTTGSEASASGSVLLAFSSDHCGACQAMRPTLHQLEQAGVPIRHVNVNAEADFARRHGIRQTPTFVVWSAGQELTRLVGMQSAPKLQQALAMSPAGTFVPTGANFQPNGPATNTAQSRPPSSRRALANPSVANDSGANDAANHFATGATQGELMPSSSLAQAVERAQAATVRLRVQDGRGFGVGTGTVIDRHGPEALVLTCGHLFRETKIESKVQVDLFVGGQIKTVAGQVVDYDSEERDIALVVIQPGFDITPVPVLPAGEAPQSGQSVFSFGCDHGDDPSRRDTRITGVNKYNQHLGASNLEIAGAPVDGRSGGGLFDAQGRLIGVCNAADYKGDTGIYTGPGSVQWQLDRVQLSHLYQGSGNGSGNPSPIASPRQQPQQPPARLASVGPSHGLDRNVMQASDTTPSAQEVLVIVRDPNHPGSERVITVTHPTAELMEMIGRHSR